MIRATMSSAPLLSCCQWWAREGVPWVTAGNDDAMAFGNAVDAWVRWYVSGANGDPPPPGDVDTSDYQLTCMRLREWLDAFGLEGMRAQVAFAWSLETDTARELPAVDRDYSAKLPGEYCGTADLVVVRPDEVVIIDVKTGWQTDAEQYDEQLNDYALAAARAHDKSSARVVALKGSSTRCYARERSLDAFDLDDVAALRRAQLEAVEVSQPTPGAHCTERWCKAVAACPAQQAAAAQIIPATSLVRHAWGLTISSPEHAVWLRDQAKLVAEAAEQVLAAVKDYARANDGLPTKPGKVWAEVPSTRSSIDGKAALALAEKLGASQDDLAACMRSAVVKSFREVNAKGRAA